MNCRDIVIVEDDKIIKELKDIGYDGNISWGREGFSDSYRNYAYIQFHKKGNAKLIKDILELGWEKRGERKTHSLEPRYNNYSMIVCFRKYF